MAPFPAPPADRPLQSPPAGRSAGDGGSSTLPPRALHVWNATTVAFALPLAAAAVAAALLWGEGAARTLLWLAAALVAVVAVLDILLVNRIRHRSYSYTVDENEVYIAKGALIRHTVDVAVPQVLSVHVTRGPVQRALGLASVRFVNVVEGESLGPVDAAEADRITRVVLEGLERRRAESASALGRAAGVTA